MLDICRPSWSAKRAKIRRLETGGMVVGLFDHMLYEESTVSLAAGEIFLAL